MSAHQRKWQKNSKVFYRNNNRRRDRQVPVYSKVPVPTDKDDKMKERAAMRNGMQQMQLSSQVSALHCLPNL